MFCSADGSAPHYIF